MAILHQTWETITFAYFDGMLDDEELYNANKTWNAKFKYCEYREFDLNQYNDDECNAYFR